MVNNLDLCSYLVIFRNYVSKSTRVGTVSPNSLQRYCFYSEYKYVVFCKL